MSRLLLLVGIIGFLGLGGISPTVAQESAKGSTDNKPVPPPRMAVLGNDAEALLSSYCVFQSQVYSVGVAFCSGEMLLMQCTKSGTQPASWQINTGSANCKGFGK